MPLILPYYIYISWKVKLSQLQNNIQPILSTDPEIIWGKNYRYKDISYFANYSDQNQCSCVVCIVNCHCVVLLWYSLQLMQICCKLFTESLWQWTLLFSHDSIYTLNLKCSNPNFSSLLINGIEQGQWMRIYSLRCSVCNKTFPLFSPWILGQIGLPMTVLKSARHEDSQTTPTCLIWWSFGWVI